MVKENPHTCPVKGKHEFPEWNSYEICLECGLDSLMKKVRDPEVGIWTFFLSVTDRERGEFSWRRIMRKSTRSYSCF